MSPFLFLFFSIQLVFFFFNQLVLIFESRAIKAQAQLCEVLNVQAQLGNKYKIFKGLGISNRLLLILFIRKFLFIYLFIFILFQYLVGTILFNQLVLLFESRVVNTQAALYRVLNVKTQLNKKYEMLKLGSSLNQAYKQCLSLSSSKNPKA